MRQHRWEVRETIKKVDETISAMCDEIQREIKEESINREIIPEMVKALAELMSARAKMENG